MLMRMILTHTTDLEDISKFFSAHFGQLGIIFIWLSDVFPWGTFSNYEALLSDPTHIKPSAQVVYNCRTGNFKW
jgi:photosystem I P700 chlorophyll a apoprotein A1